MTKATTTPTTSDTESGATERAALATMVYESVRFANWAAGEGIYPVEGEPARDPGEFLSEFCQAIGSDDYAGLESLARDAVTAAPAAHSQLRAELDAAVEALQIILANTEDDAIPHIAHSGMSAYQSLAKDIADCARAALLPAQPALGMGREEIAAKIMRFIGEEICTEELADLAATDIETALSRAPAPEAARGNCRNCERPYNEHSHETGDTCNFYIPMRDAAGHAGGTRETGVASGDDESTKNLRDASSVAEAARAEVERLREALRKIRGGSFPNAGNYAAEGNWQGFTGELQRIAFAALAQGDRTDD